MYCKDFILDTLKCLSAYVPGLKHGVERETIQAIGDREHWKDEQKIVRERNEKDLKTTKIMTLEEGRQFE